MKGGIACSLLAASLLAAPSRCLVGRDRADPGGRRGEHGLARHRLPAGACAARQGRRQHLRRRRLAAGRAVRREGPDVGRGRGHRIAGARRARPSRQQRHRPAAPRPRPAEGPGAGAVPGAACRHRGDRPGKADFRAIVGCGGIARPSQHVTVNIGTIEGGTSPNLVPDPRHRPRRHPPAGRNHHRRAGGPARRMAGAAGRRDLAGDPPLRALLHRARARDRPYAPPQSPPRSWAKRRP